MPVQVDQPTADNALMTAGGTELLDAPAAIMALDDVAAMELALASRPLGSAPIQETHANEVDLFDMPTDQKIDRAIAAIDAVMEAKHPVAIGFSAGKDSSVLMSLVIEAAMRRKEAGKDTPHIVVTHAHTGIENPSMAVVASAEIERIRAYAEKHHISLQVDIAAPYLNDTWAVRIISGRALPTFANSSTRDCSISWKIVPQQRQRKKVFKELAAMGQPVIMTGTRFDESTVRGAAMAGRGERDNQLWEQTSRDKAGKVTHSELRLSPIAYWTQEDIWTFLADLAAGARESYSDSKEIWDVYRDGGNSSCAVVSDDAMKASAKACGARFGCALCTAVGRDKSMEAMLEANPKHAYMLHLNRLQRFLVDSQYDLARREWVGRSIDAEGFIAIAPDAYSASMQRELLRYALTIDQIEREDARANGLAPRFELVSLQQLMAIDSIWSMQGYHPRPFEAWHIWRDIQDGQRYYPPEVTPPAEKEAKKMPAAKWLYVGANWQDEPGFDHVYSGARNLLADLTGATESGGCMHNVELSDGRVVMGVHKSDFFEMPEDQVIADFVWMEIEEGGLLEKSANWGPGAAYRHYQTLGMLSTTTKHLGMQDELLRRAAWKERHGVFEMSVDDLLARSVTAAERKTGLLCPPHTTLLRDDARAQLDLEFHNRRGAVEALAAQQARWTQEARQASLFSPSEASSPLGDGASTDVSGAEDTPAYERQRA